jgi:hypothetical protein
MLETIPKMKETLTMLSGDVELNCIEITFEIAILSSRRPLAVYRETTIDESVSPFAFRLGLFGCVQIVQIRMILHM